MSTYYDARNASLTLGMEILNTNSNIRKLLFDATSRENIFAVQAMIDWLDGYLQHYRLEMKLSYFDKDKNSTITYDNYEKAIKEIFSHLKKTEDSLEDDPLGRLEYVYWLNRWSELLASCFPKLGLLPPSRADGPQRQLIDETNDEDEEEPEVPIANMGDFEEEEVEDGTNENSGY